MIFSYVLFLVFTQYAKPSINSVTVGGDVSFTPIIFSIWYLLFFQAFRITVRIFLSIVRLILTSDSKYVIDSVTKGWVYSWQKKNWKKSDGKPALNVDLWQELLPLLEKHNVTFNWIKGHRGHPENERCDEIAVAEREKAAQR